jgi:hypothetical protein
VHFKKNYSHHFYSMLNNFSVALYMSLKYFRFMPSFTLVNEKFWILKYFAFKRNLTRATFINVLLGMISHMVTRYSSKRTPIYIFVTVVKTIHV